MSDACSRLVGHRDGCATSATVQDAKTPAGVRRVKIRGGLMRELARFEGTDGYAFPTRTGKQLGAENFRNRVWAAAVREADKALAKAELSPLPDKLTPHSMRRTFASVLYGIGEPPTVVKREMGHTDEGLALRIYADAMERGEKENAELRALVGGEWTPVVDGASQGLAIESAIETSEPPRPRRRGKRHDRKVVHLQA